MLTIITCFCNLYNFCPCLFLNFYIIFLSMTEFVICIILTQLSLLVISLLLIHVHFRPTPWSRGNIVTSQWARVRSRSGQFPGWGFFHGFPSTVRQLSGNVDYIRPRLSYGHCISYIIFEKYKSHFQSQWCNSILLIQSHSYIRRGNRRLSLAALPGLPAASRGVKLPLLANTRSVF